MSTSSSDTLTLICVAFNTVSMMIKTRMLFVVVLVVSAFGQNHNNLRTGHDRPTLVAQTAFLELVGLPVQTAMSDTEVDTLKDSIVFGYNNAHKTIGKLKELTIDSTKIIRRDRQVNDPDGQLPFNWVFGITLDGECYKCDTFNDFREGGTGDREENLARHAAWEKNLCDSLRGSGVGIFTGLELCKVEFP